MKRGALIVGCLLALTGSVLLLLRFVPAGAVTDAPPRPDAALALDPELEKAINAAHEAALSRPRDAGARATLAMIYDAAHMYALADETYAQALALDDDQAEWWYHRARSRESIGDKAGALELLRRAAELAPDQFIIPVRMGVWQLESGEAEQAAASFRAALALQPDARSAQLGLARTYVALDQPADALPLLEALRASLPRDCSVRQLLGRCYARLGRAAEATAELSLGITSAWDWMAEDPWFQHMLSHRAGYRARLDRGMMMIAGGAGPQAVPLLEALRADYPDDVPVALALCAAHESAGRMDKALAVLTQIDLRQPDHFAVKLNLARVQQLQGNLVEAARATAAAIALNPTLAAGHVQMARLRIAQQQLDEALAAADEAIRCDAGSADAKLVKAEVLLGKRQFAEASQILEGVTRAHPDLAQGFAMLAAARFNMGKATEAAAALSQAERIDPNDPTLKVIHAQLQRASNAASAGGR